MIKSKGLAIASAAIFIMTLIFLTIGLVFQTSCTDLNQLLGNCANPTLWYVLTGISVIVALGLLASSFE